VEAVQRLLAPSSLALVGVTESSNWSQALVANLRGLGFQGRLHMVNPRHRTVFDQPCHGSVLDIPDQVDGAYVMTGTSVVPRVVEECGERAIRSISVLTSGFKEVGGEGVELERKLTSRCRELGIAMLGPNCLGFVNYPRRTAAYALPLAPPLRPGGIGILTQSGAMLIHIHRLALARGTGLSLLVSSGNEAMLDSVALLETMLEDPETRVLAALIEGIRDGPGFVRLAERAMAAGKPLVVLKLGRSRAAARAATAHTGALAGEDRVVDAVLRRLGVVRVDSLEEMMETAAVLASGQVPRGRRTGVIAPSGGACGMIADLAEGTSIELPDLGRPTLDALSEILPPFATPQNPLDTTGYVVLDPTLLARAVETVARDPAVDNLLVVSDPPREPAVNAQATRERSATLGRVLAAGDRFAIVSASVSGEMTDFGREVAAEARLYFANGIPLAVKALDRAITYGEARRRARRRPVHPDPARRAAAHALMNGAGGPLSEARSMELLDLYGLPTPPRRLARGASEAAEAAAELGFPVVLKVQSADIPHKTEAGAVALGVTDREAAALAFARVTASARRHHPAAAIEGTLVTPQIQPVAELIAGAMVDPQFGPLVLLGLGGLLAEAIDQVVLRPAPLDEDDAREMLDELPGSAVLTGARGRPVADLAALAAALIRLGDLATELSHELLELDINPLFALPEGQGALAGDALAVLREETTWTST
jgi:acetate---CoA ligase (ADP-forming)